MKNLTKTKIFNVFLPTFLSVALLVGAGFVYLFFNQNVPEAQAGWYNSGGTWSYRKTITIDHTKVSGGNNLTNFPMLYSVTDTDLKYTGFSGKMGKSDGTDMVFTDSDGTTKLAHEIESYSSSTGATIVWIKIPTLSANVDTTIYIYFGNAAASDMQTVAPTKTAVWSSNYKAIYHLTDGTTLSGADSTSNSNNATNHSAAANNGQIDGGGGFTGTQYLNASSNSGLQPTVFTISFWEKTTGTGNTVLFEKDGDSGFSVQQDTGSGLGMKVNVGGSSSIAINTSNLAADGNWHNIVFTYNGSNDGHAYVDGIEHTDTNSPGVPAYGAADLLIGSRSGSLGFNGSLDEVRLSNSVLSSAWIATEYSNQKTPSSFYSISGSQPFLRSADTAGVKLRGGGGSKPNIKIRGSLPTGFSLVQNVTNATCDTSGTCSVTVASTGSGHLLVLVGQAFQASAGLVYFSASGGGTWTHCPSSFIDNNYFSNNHSYADCAYILSSTSGATTITWDWQGVGGTFSFASVTFLEYAYVGGTLSYDTGATSTASSCTSCVGTGLTLTGTNDVVVEFSAQENSATAISAPYNHPSEFDANGWGIGAAINSSSGAAPTWTQNSSGIWGSAAVAFKLSASGSSNPSVRFH